LSSQLISETTRATTVENEIKAIATTNKSELTALINAEVNRATTKENSIESKLQEDVQSLSDRIDTNSELIRLSDATAVATEVVEIRKLTNDTVERLTTLTLYDLNSDADDVLTILDGGEPPQ
jgi:division protein CdvB (Snf7/Vps24/ESCRT-III family)